MNTDIEKIKLTGTEMNYYFVCERKLWLFSKGITMESESEAVAIGKVLHENSFSKEKHKEVLIDNLIKIDVVTKSNIKEIKSSSKMLESDKMQVYYYLFYLEQLGIYKTGEINYVKEKKKIKLELTNEIKNKILKSIEDINKLKNSELPPKVRKTGICSKCSYHNLCFIDE